MNKLKKLIMMAQQEDVPYLCIESLEDGMQISLSDNGYSESVEYSFDKLRWNVLPAGMFTPEANTGTKIYLRGGLTPHCALKDSGTGAGIDADIANSKGIGQFTISKKCNLSGTPCSLIFKDKVSSYSYISGLHCAFARLFKGTPVVNVLNPDFLPIKNLSQCCFYQMFANCMELEDADLEIPSTEQTSVVTTRAYYYMFYNCSKLRQGIRRLNHAMGSYTCQGMYYNCSKLERGTDITTENRASTEAIYGMYYSCYNLVNPPIINITGGEANFAWDSFRNCTSLQKTPIIRGSFLITRNWLYAFMGCKSLKEVWWLPLHAPKQESNAQWLDNVASEGTVYLNKNITWNPENYRNGSYTTNSSGESVKITWGFPANWAIKYCDPVTLEVKDSK